MRASRKVLALMAMVALPARAGSPLDVQSSMAVLERAGGATDHELVASALNAIRRADDGRRAAATLSGLLRHQSKLYAGRDKTLVVRLRVYVMATLSDVGVPPEALPAVLETLANLDQRMAPAEAGAAARAAGSLGPRGRPFVEHLLFALSLERFDVEEFSLERYEPVYPAEEATTVRLEAIRSLGKICSQGDAGVIEDLAALATAADSRVAREARHAVSLIRNRRNP